MSNRTTYSRSTGQRNGAPARSVHVEDVPAIKGMLIRGDLQSDIAAFFGTNGGRICEINTKQRHASIKPAPEDKLPPPGPYMAARSALRAKDTLTAVRDLIDDTLQQISLWETSAP